MSDQDRETICSIISNMLDNPGDGDIYCTSTAYAQLEHYAEQVRAEALGWMHAACCIALDRGNDPRLLEVPALLEQARKDLG